MEPISVIIDINAPAETVFDVVTDLQSYAKWLPDSDIFKGTTEVSETPIKAGTTYIESTPAGTRPGRVLELEPPSRVVFSQPLNLNPEVEGHLIDITVEVLVKKKGERATSLVRNVYLGYPEALKTLQMEFDKNAGDEGARVIRLLKKYAESLPK